MKTLVIYDIHDDGQRGKLREHLREYGLRRVQYSGFLGDLNTHDRLILAKEAGRFLSSENDSIYILPLCDRCLRLCRIIDQSGVSTIPETEVEIVT
jgi:CRISPR-associated protein Cas2